MSASHCSNVQPLALKLKVHSSRNFFNNQVDVNSKPRFKRSTFIKHIFLCCGVDSHTVDLAKHSSRALYTLNSTGYSRSSSADRWSGNSPLSWNQEFIDYLSTGSENSPWLWQIKHSAYSALHNPIFLLTLISPYSHINFP